MSIRGLVLPLTFGLVACAPTSPSKSETSGEVSSSTERSSPSEHRGAGTAATSASSGGRALELGAHGLPLTIDAPACATIETPQVKIDDNRRDVMLHCEPRTEGKGIDERTIIVFDVQIGPAQGKVGEKEIAAEDGFQRWIKKEGGLLVWEVAPFGNAAREFMLRKTIGGAQYACFSQFPTTDDSALESMIAACKSLR